MLGQLRGVDHADVVQQPHDEAADACEVGHFGVEQPASAAQRADVPLGERILLAQQVVGQQPQFEPHAVALRAVHAEGVDEPLGVGVGVLPRRVGRFDLADARGLEELADAVLGVVAPHLHVVGREGEGFDAAVAHLAAVGRPVAVQDDLPLLLDRLDQVVDVRGVPSPDDRVGQRAVVVDRVELAFEVLFQQVRVVDVLDGALEDHGLLFGEVDELRDVAEMGRLLVEADAVACLLDDETRLAEGVDIAVDGAARHVEPLGQLVDVVGGVGREQLHEPQQAFELRLIHAVGCSGRAKIVKLARFRMDLGRIM